MVCYQCSSCKERCYSSAALRDLKYPYCPYCGGEIRLAATEEPKRSNRLAGRTGEQKLLGDGFSRGGL